MEILDNNRLYNFSLGVTYIPNLVSFAWLRSHAPQSPQNFAPVDDRLGAKVRRQSNIWTTVFAVIGSALEVQKAECVPIWICFTKLCPFWAIFTELYGWPQEWPHISTVSLHFYYCKKKWEWQGKMHSCWLVCDDLTKGKCSRSGRGHVRKPSSIWEIHEYDVYECVL